MFKKFSKYLLIGVSALALFAAAQQGLFNKNNEFVLADDPPIDEGPGCDGNVSVWGLWQGEKLIEVKERVGVIPGQCNQPQRVDLCQMAADGSGTPVETCQDAFGNTGHRYCVWRPEGNIIGGCSIEVCRFGGAPPNNCNSEPAQAAPAQQAAQQQQTQQAAQVDCSTCGNNNQAACTGACRSSIGNCHDGFFIQSDGFCRAPQQQQVNECPRSDFENGHPQRCVNGRFVQCFCDSQGCTWQHDNGTCGGTTPPAPPQPPAPICRSITCPAAPAGCAFSGQIKNTCNSAVTLTCGALTCNPAPPAGGTTSTNNNCTGNNSCSGGGATVTITNPAPQAVLAAVPAAASVPVTFANVGIGTSAVAVTALPKTGLPVLVWSALAFIPAGFKIRGFSKLRRVLENKASFIWEERQFKG